MRMLLKIAGGLVALVLLALGGLFGKAQLGIGRVREIPLRPITVTADSAAIARGRHLASAIMKCVDCHGEDLAGRDPMFDAPIGRVATPNLTPGRGGILGSYGDAELARAIRHGVALDGRPIPVMPAEAYSAASDADVGAVIGYLRSLPPVDRAVPPSTIRPLGRLLYAAGKLPFLSADQIDHDAPPSPDLEPAVTIEYGRYLATIGGCLGCHGPGLSGGKIPGTPPDWKPATNITPAGLAGWTEADFRRALETGIRPNGTPIDTLMPWRLAGKMDSVELAAVWRFLQSAPPKPYGGR